MQRCPVLPPLAQFLLSEFGWRTAYVALGVLTFVVTLPAALVATRNAAGSVRRFAAPLRIGPMLFTRAYVLMALIFVLPQLTTLDSAPLANTLCELLAASIRPALASSAADSIAATIRQRATAEIDARLRDPALSVEQIHRAVGVSRSRLYEALEPFGGVSAVIQERRLRASRIALQQPANIGEVARTLGFTSSSHFSAAFRRRFGCRPRDVMLSGAGVAPLNALADTEGETPWVDWIRTLWD